MAISYQTKIRSLQTAEVPHKGTVTVVEGYLYGIDSTDGKNTTALFSQSLPTPAEGGSFIPYESLTESQVISWVDSTMSADERAFLEARIASKIESMRTGSGGGDFPVAPPLPWPTPEPTPITAE